MTFRVEVSKVTSPSVVAVSISGQIPHLCSAMVRILIGINSPTSGIAMRFVNKKFAGKLSK